jgi:hypothetical protein
MARPRVIQRAFVNGQRGDVSLTLTEARADIRASRRYADVYNVFECTDRAGDRLHIVYARYQGGSERHGFSAFTDATVTYLYEVTDDALRASFGLI